MTRISIVIIHQRFVSSPFASNARWRPPMFSPEVIKARVKEKPFRPLRVTVSEGISYDINHPDLIWVGWNDVQIGFASPDHPTIYDRTTRVAMSHVIALEDIPSPAPADNNGQK